MSIPFLSDIILKKGNKIEFTTEAGASAGSIDIDTSGNLVLSNTAGDILLGDGASDVYVGDGTNNVDILFEQSGSIKADDGASGVTLTLGSSNTTLAFGGATSFADVVSSFSPTAINTVDIGTNAKPFKNIYAAHHVGGSSINYATSRGWVEDAAGGSYVNQVGYYGGNFSRNGDESENAVVWGIDPFGNKALLWKAIGQTSDDDDDGGWNKDITIPANNNIGYLSYYYFKIDFTPNESSDGQFYHGCGTTAGQTINLSDGSNNTNPYFNNGVLTTSNNGGAFVANRWYLSIGIIQAYNNETTDTDTITGVYDVETGEKVRSGSEFKMGNNTTGQRHRAYLYYQSSTSSGNMYFWNPGFHAIDGSEPKIQDLVKRQVYLNDNVKAAFGNSNDLNIYHNGSHSFIQDTGTGDLRLLASSIKLQNTSESNILTLNSDLSATFAGAVGIGTAPASSVELHVNGDVRVDATDGVATRKIRSGYFSSTTDIRVESGSSGDVILGDNSAARLTLASDDNATFAGNIELASSKRIRWGAGDAQIEEGSTANYSLDFSTYDGSSMTKALTLLSNNDATFTGNLTISGQLDGVTNMFLGEYLYHQGDGDTYLNFQNANEFRIVIGGSEKIHFNTSRIRINDDLHAAADSSYDIGTSSVRFANIYADTLYGDGSNLTNLPAQSAPSNMVTTDGSQTITHAKNFTSASMQHNGHLYYNAYDSQGQHYPHFRDGTASNGVDINWRQYYGSNYKTHQWTSDSSGNMAQIFQGRIEAVGELKGTSLDINGDGDVSGTLTVGTISATNYGLASGDIPNNAANTSGNAATATTASTANNLQGFDDRDMAPEDLSYSDDLKLFFSAKEGLEDGTSTGSDWHDVLVLNSYSDSSGGNANVLAFDKNSYKIRHYQAGLSASNWGTAKELAYTASPTFTGTPAAPTASAGTNTTQIATTAFVGTAVSNLVDSAPGTLNTLNELAAALGDDASFSTTTATALGNRVRVDTASQNLSNDQKSNARTNIGAQASGNYLTSVAYTDLTGTVPTWNQNTTGTSASSAKLTDGGSLTTHPGTSNLIYTGQISNGTTGLFAAVDNSNSVITLNRHSGEYNSQLGFSSNGNIYYRKKSNTANNTQAWKVLAFTDSDTDAANITSGTLPDARLSDNVFVTRSATVVTASDWDTFTTQGTYGVASGSGAQFTGNNRPITSGGIEPDYRYGHLVVTEDSGGQGIQQTYYPHSGNRVMFRTGWNNGSWTNWSLIWTDRTDGSGSGLDADLLDGQHASAFSTATGVADNADVTPSWVPSSDPGYFKQGSYSAGYTGDMDSLTGFRIIRSTSGSNRAFSGHHNVITLPNTGASQYGAQLAFETGTVADGGIKFRSSTNGTFTSWYRLYHEGHLPTLAELGAQAAGTYSTATGVANNADVTPSWVPSSDPGYLTAHPSVSAASSSDNSGRTYIQDITLDSNGHVTGIATATETVTNTNTQLSNSQVIDAIVESTGISSSNKTTIRSNIGAQAAGNYLTGITSSQVTTALGFTPMNSSVTTISSAQAQKLGYITVTQAVNLDTIETNASQGATAYGYGDHADAGYLTSFDITTQTDNKYLRSDQSDQVNGNLIYLDNVKAAFGTSSDFQIYHDGTNNIIKNTKHGQNTYLQSENSSGTNQNCIVFGGSGGSAELRYNNANRLLTTTNGVELNGSITLNNKLELSYASTSGSQFEQASSSVVTYRVNSDRFRIWMGGGSNETFTVAESGRVGINDSTPDYTLDVSGNVSNISIYASHDIAAYSDARVKDEIETIPNALDKVNKLRGVTFVRTDEGSTDKRMMGVIAQEVKDILPEVVNERESDGHYSVSYGNMVGVLIEAVKELTAEVEELKKCGKCDNCNCKNK